MPPDAQVPESRSATSRARRTVVRLALGALLLAVYVHANPASMARLARMELRNQIVFVALHLLALAILAALTACSRALAVPALALALLSVVIDNAHLAIRHYPLTLADLDVLLEATGSTSAALAEYRPEIGRATLAAALLVGTVVALRAVTARRRYATRAGLAGVAAALAAYVGIAVARGEQALAGAPSIYTLPLGGVALWLDPARAVGGAKLVVAPRAMRPLPARPRRIVLVIDESVEGERFHRANRAPFRNGVDLGNAFSATNCTVTANRALRYGSDPRDPSQRTEPLFALARRAGYTTLYVDLDGVLAGGVVRNYFSSAELQAVDRVLGPQEFGAKHYDRDVAFARAFAPLVQEHERAFVIVNKVGTHFPYAWNLPPDVPGGEDAYATSMERATIAFLHRLDETLPSSTFVLYTSDHGQAFGSRSPHCNGEPEASLPEWRVPLVVLASPDLMALREIIDARWTNRASHFEAAETIRVLLGYEALFSPTLLDAPVDGAADYRAYFGPWNGLLGMPARHLTFRRDALGPSGSQAVASTADRSARAEGEKAASP